MDLKILLLFVLCFCLPQCSLQQAKGGKIDSNYDGGFPHRQEPSNWKSILIIVVGVAFFGAIIYGTSCFYVCKMHFFERTEKKYTKMDSITHV